MDNKAQEFARKIISELEVIKTLIVDAVSHPREQNDGSEKQHDKTDAGKQQPLARRKSSPSKIDPPVGGNNPAAPAKNERFPRLTEWKPLIEIVGIGALVVYTGITMLMWYEARKANKISTVAMLGSQRPWVGIDEVGGVQTTEPLTIDGSGGVRADCTVTVKNYGPYPAQHLIPDCSLVVIQGNISPVKDRMMELCRQEAPPFGNVLFPGGKSLFKWAASVGRNQFLHNGDGQFVVFLIGSVVYADQSMIPHCTTFAYKRNLPGTISTVSFEATPNTVIPGVWVQWDGAVDPKQKPANGTQK